MFSSSKFSWYDDRFDLKSWRKRCLLTGLKNV